MALYPIILTYSSHPYIDIKLHHDFDRLFFSNLYLTVFLGNFFVYFLASPQKNSFLNMDALGLKNHLEIVKLLIKAKADVNQVDHDHSTVLHKVRFFVIQKLNLSAFF